jgi:hypothetical protein
MQDYWRRQIIEKPLFDDLLWSRPENKLYAGKLLIVGGNVQGFAAPGEAFGIAETNGVGAARVILPDSLQKTVGKMFPAAEFAPSTPSGSFASTALAELIATAAWSEGVLLAGDLGRNSETAIVLESFASKYSGLLIITRDAADYFITTPTPLIGRKDTLLVISFAQLQKLAMAAKFTTAFTFSMDFLHLVDALHVFTKQLGMHVIVKHLDTLFVAVNGQVTTTKIIDESKRWRLSAAASASVWWIQNPSKPLEALTTSIVARTK